MVVNVELEEETAPVISRAVRVFPDMQTEPTAIGAVSQDGRFLYNDAPERRTDTTRMDVILGWVGELRARLLQDEP